MPRRLIYLILASLLVTALLPVANAPAQEAEAPAGVVRAGYGEADATWHVGAGAGQYSEKRADPTDPGGLPGDVERVISSVSGGDVDPHGHAITQKNSYGVQSRLSYRAIVVEDAQGDQVAFVKSDSYLAQDYLARRAGQILLLAGAETEISYDEIFHMASHNHSSPYYMTPSPGVWIFQDAFDIRAFEYHARAMAEAIMKAEDSMVDARMGATTVEHKLFKGMIQRKGDADDGTPRGYPDDFGDLNLPVIRFDNIEDPSDPKPLATLINWGQHPEGLDDHDLITGDFVAPLERLVERETGAPLVFGQGDVGSAEAGPGHPDLVAAEGVPAKWSHVGHAQGERGAFLLSRDVVKGWQEIETGNPVVKFSSTFDVAAGNAWVAGPYSHPYPSVSNCRTEKTVEGKPIAPGPPECIGGEDGFTPDEQLWEKLKAAGVQLPDNYDLPSYASLEENTRLHLQAFKLGEVVLASCACEAQVDLILNFETRANETPGDIWDGYDWRDRMNCSQADAPTGNWTCTRRSAEEGELRPGAVHGGFTVTNYEYKRMDAQIHNDAAGWDDLENVDKALSEPSDPTAIFGNFTKEELSEETGYKLPIGVGHASDYNGYTVSYREYQSWDDYRKSLTSYGPHTADYMVTRMVRLAAKLNGQPQPGLELDIQRGLPDEGRQTAMSSALGAASFATYEAWQKALPVDKGPIEAIPEKQPKDIRRFQAATFSWRGGSNAIDNPTVIVQRCPSPPCDEDDWVTFADQSGEVQTKVDFPKGANAFANTYSGNQEWIWTANFEAFNAFPAGIGSTPEGEYRFVVEGKARTAPGTTTGYELPSETFIVSGWDGINVKSVSAGQDGSVSFEVDPIVYPTTYPTTHPSEFSYVNGETQTDQLGRTFCTRCSFRPWAAGSDVQSAAVTVVRADGSTTVVPATRGADGSWQAPADLYQGDTAYVDQGGVEDNYGETNGTRSATVEGVRDRPQEPQKITTALSLTVSGKNSKLLLTAHLYEAASSSKGIPSQKIDFFADGVFIGSGVTSSQGTVTFRPTNKYWRASAYEARYAGSDQYTAASSRPL